MGVYYYFYNDTQSVPNDKNIPGYNLPFVAKFDWLPEYEIIKIFKSVIDVNKWSVMDIIQAEPDDNDHPLIIYQDGNIEFIDPSEYDEDYEDDYDY